MFQVASTRSRADVKAEVIAARQAGELLPAGERNAISNGAQPAYTRTAVNPFKAVVELARGKHQSGT